MQYRAAYWISADKQSDVVLTAPEHSSLSDDDLLIEAAAEFERGGLKMDGGTIVVGTWTD